MLQRAFATTLLLILGSAANAADLPSRHAPPVFAPAPPVFSWTGFYVGGQVGYEFGRDAINAPNVFPTVALNPKGIVGGAHVGYAFQASQYVIGIEGDVNGSGYSASGLNPFNGATLGTRSPIDGSIRGRVGVAFDRALFYATGGAAFASIKNSYTDAAGGFSAVSRTRVGYTVGGGVDYALTNNWAVDVEYRYTDYGRFSDFPGAVVNPRIHHETDNRVQAGFSYRFDSIVPVAPVVARY